jgi:hypothetical protein
MLGWRPCLGVAPPSSPRVAVGRSAREREQARGDRLEAALVEARRPLRLRLLEALRQK